MRVQGDRSGPGSKGGSHAGERLQGVERRGFTIGMWSSMLKHACRRDQGTRPSGLLTQIDSDDRRRGSAQTKRFLVQAADAEADVVLT